MTSRPPNERPRSAEVLNLMCARFEAALAEGSVDASLRQHEQNCDRCADFARELSRVEALICDATAPSESIPDDFLDEIMRRAEGLDGRYSEDKRGGWRRNLPAAMVIFVAAAAVLLAFWAGGAREQMRQVDTPKQVRVTQSLETAVETEVARSFVSTSTMALKSDLPKESPPRVMAKPRVPAAAPVPEPVVDIGAEIQVMLREKVSQSEDCPKESAQAVWVTATIQSDGSLTERSVMSAGGASAAHRCVTRALDQLILAPGVPKTTVSFELTW